MIVGISRCLKYDWLGKLSGYYTLDPVCSSHLDWKCITKADKSLINSTCNGGSHSPHSNSPNNNLAVGSFELDNSAVHKHRHKHRQLSWIKFTFWSNSRGEGSMDKSIVFPSLICFNVTWNVNAVTIPRFFCIHWLNNPFNRTVRQFFFY